MTLRGRASPSIVAGCAGLVIVGLGGASLVTSEGEQIVLWSAAGLFGLGGIAAIALAWLARLTIDGNGITLRSPTRHAHYAWSNVADVRVIRAGPSAVVGIDLVGGTDATISPQLFGVRAEALLAMLEAARRRG
jgi:hypothetical protein